MEERIENEALIRRRLAGAMGVLKTRARTLVELAEQSYFLIKPRPFVIEGKAAKPLNEEARARLGRLYSRLSDTEDWTAEALSALLQSFAEAEDIGFGKVGQPLRAALTGGSPAPDLAQVMVFLGREEALQRIKEQMAPSE